MTFVSSHDFQGRTALAVVEERLSSNIQSESGQSFGYELAEDHRAIRDFLLAESRRRGYRLEDVERGSTPGATEVRALHHCLCGEHGSLQVRGRLGGRPNRNLS